MNLIIKSYINNKKQTNKTANVIGYYANYILVFTQ